MDVSTTGWRSSGWSSASALHTARTWPVSSSPSALRGIVRHTNTWMPGLLDLWTEWVSATDVSPDGGDADHTRLGAHHQERFTLAGGRLSTPLMGDDPPPKLIPNKNSSLSKCCVARVQRQGEMTEDASSSPGTPHAVTSDGTADLQSVRSKSCDSVVDFAIGIKPFVFGIIVR